jgi:hypothetical protein
MDTVDETPAPDRRDQPGARADGRRQEQAVEREAHGVQQGVLRWCGPLLEEQRARRGRDQVTEHKEEPRQKQAEERPRQPLQHEKGQSQKE